MPWKEVQRKQFNGNRWNWREDLGEIIGEYLGTVTMQGRFGKDFNIHTIKSESDNNIWEFTGSTVLDGKLEQIKEKTRVRIIALGEVQGERGQKYWDWSVQIWEN